MFQGSGCNQNTKNPQPHLKQKYLTLLQNPFMEK